MSLYIYYDINITGRRIQLENLHNLHCFINSKTPRHTRTVDRRMYVNDRRYNTLVAGSLTVYSCIKPWTDSIEHVSNSERPSD